MDSPANMTVCRVCLAMNVKLYHISEPKLSAMYERVTGVELNAEDKLPKNICWECVARLTSANNFIVKALKTQWTLMNKIDGRFITIEDIKSIDRAEHHLESTLGSKFYDVNDCNLHIVEDSVETGTIDACTDKTIEEAGEIISFEDMRDTELSERKAEDDDISVEEEIYVTEVEISCETDPIRTKLSDLNEDVKDDGYEAGLKYVDGNTDTNKEQFQICEEEDVSNEEILYNRSATLSRCKEVILKDVYLSNYDIQDYNDNTHLTGENECHSSIEDYNNTNMETLFNGADTGEALKLGIIDLGNNRQTINTNTSMVHTNSKSMLNDSISLDKLFICDICNKSFHHKYKLIRHILKYQKTYSCTSCTYKAHRKTYLDVHINANHTKSSYFNCPHCSFKTYQKEDFNRHVKYNHINNTSSHCSYSSYKAHQKSDLSRHINDKHTKKDLFNCSYCSYKTNRRGNLTVHINAIHTKSVSYNCSYCSYKTYQKGCLNLHINSKHSDGVSFNCSFCSYKASNKQNLDRHVNATHSKPKPNLSKRIVAKRSMSTTFICSFCSFETCGKMSLERHINATHTKSTSYNCTHCSYKVYDKSSLSKHINAKHTKIDINCPHCSYKSYYKSAVNRHIKAKHS